MADSVMIPGQFHFDAQNSLPGCSRKLHAAVVGLLDDVFDRQAEPLVQVE
jgi:hypothetical protein